MLTSTPARTFVSALIAVLLMGVPSAMAASEQNDPSTKEPYRKAIKYGVAEYDAQHFEEALGYFRRAHEIYPNARTYRGIGMASFELRDYVTAVRSLTAALADERKPLSADQRKDTQDLIERCQNFLAVYRLKVTPADARVTVDTAAPEFQPDGSLMLGLGAHVVEGRAKGYVTRTLSIHVRGRERQELVLALDPVPPPSTARATVNRPRAEPVVTVPAQRQLPPDNSSAKVWLWTGGGLAALSVGSGIYWANRSSALSSCRAGRQDYQCDNESLLKLERNIGVAGTIVTGVAALTAVTIGIMSWKSGPAALAKNPSLACAVGPFQLTCGGAF